MRVEACFQLDHEATDHPGTTMQLTEYRAQLEALGAWGAAVTFYVLRVRATSPRCTSPTPRRPPMIRFRFPGSSQHPAPIAFIGLSDDNLTRLRAGMPIRVNADDPLGLAMELVIYHGHSEVDMTEELERNGFMPVGSTAKAQEAINRRGEFRHEGQP